MHIMILKYNKCIIIDLLIIINFSACADCAQTAEITVTIILITLNTSAQDQYVEPI